MMLIWRQLTIFKAEAEVLMTIQLFESHGQAVNQ
jgi:hypothetical protein